MTDPFDIIYIETLDNINCLMKLVDSYHEYDYNWLKDQIDHAKNNIQESIDDLSDTINIALMDPTRFNLTLSIINERQLNISQMQEKLNKIKIPISTTDINISTKNIQSNSFIHSQQTQQFHPDIIMEKQNKNLDLIHSGVINLNNTATNISTEIDKQNSLLNDINNDVETTSGKIKKTIIQLDKLIERSGSCCPIIYIVILVIILLILILLLFTL